MNSEQVKKTLYGAASKLPDPPPTGEGTSRVDEVAEKFKKVRGPKKVKLSCYVDHRIDERLHQIRQKSDQSLSAVVEKALLEYLEIT